jgi:hypothetical protein
MGPVVVLGRHLPQLPRLLEHAAERGEVAVRRRRRVPLGQPGAQGGGVRVAEPLPGQGVEVAGAGGEAIGLSLAAPILARPILHLLTTTVSVSTI